MRPKQPDVLLCTGRKAASLWRRPNVRPHYPSLTAGGRFEGVSISGDESLVPKEKHTSFMCFRFGGVRIGGRWHDLEYEARP
jgi:hypothetical protein